MNITIEYVCTSSSESPYAEAVIVNDFIYLSGIVSENMKTGELMLGNIEHETDQVLKNVSMILEKHGSGMDKIVKVEIFLRDFKDKDQMNATYLKHFANKRLPSRVCVGVADLCDKCKIEMVVTALI